MSFLNEELETAFCSLSGFPDLETSRAFVFLNCLQSIVIGQHQSLNWGPANFKTVFREQCMVAQ
ncbi:hypothetical protein CR513_22129, partial [Mucuna pruriens]